MTNPFDDEQGTYYVVVNGEVQHSLWPAFAPVPGGWKVVCGPGTRAECLVYVEENWTDIRPRSVVASLG